MSYTDFVCILLVSIGNCDHHIVSLVGHFVLTTLQPVSMDGGDLHLLTES